MLPGCAALRASDVDAAWHGTHCIQTFGGRAKVRLNNFETRPCWEPSSPPRHALQAEPAWSHVKPGVLKAIPHGNRGLETQGQDGKDDGLCNISLHLRQEPHRWDDVRESDGGKPALFHLGGSEKVLCSWIQARFDDVPDGLLEDAEPAKDGILLVQM